MVKPNYNFELDLDDIDLIENTLSQRIHDLSLEHWKHPDGYKDHQDQIKVIHELLGKIHNQKNWYRPQKNYVSG